jgi:hypothetical protein
MNGTFVFVLCIIAIVTCGNIVSTYLKQRDKRPDNNEELEDTLSKVDELEERIRVLERIVTEKRYDLKGEIDAL